MSKPLPKEQEWARTNVFPLFIPCSKCGYKDYCDDTWRCKIMRKELGEK